MSRQKQPLPLLGGDDLYPHIVESCWDIAIQYADGSLMLRTDGLSARTLCRRGMVAGKVHPKKGLRFLVALAVRSEIRRVIQLEVPLLGGGITAAKHPDMGWAPRPEKARPHGSYMRTLHIAIGMQAAGHSRSGRA